MIKTPLVVMALLGQISAVELNRRH
jgi:hypothetical protein